MITGTAPKVRKNTELSQDIYRRLKDAGLIYTTDIEQFYDEEVGMFLADRFIKGTCPKCGAPDQYGDSCEKCSSVYSPTDLIDPYSAISGSVPVLKTSTHYFFRLSGSACTGLPQRLDDGQWRRRQTPRAS